MTLEEQQALFDNICTLAKAKNEMALKVVLAENEITIDFKHGGYTPGAYLAQQGEHAAVNFLLEKFYAREDQILYGYALRGDIKQVNVLFEQNVTRGFAKAGYEKGGHLADDENLQRIMTLTTNASFRVFLSHEAKGDNSVLLEKSTKLHRLMVEKHMSDAHYQIANGWTPALATILLQGHLFMQKNNLSVDVWLHIASYLSGVSERSTYEFLNRHADAFEMKRDSVNNPAFFAGETSRRMGKHTLFAREATLYTNKPTTELFITKVALADCLTEGQSETNDVAVPELQQLLEQDADVISYQAIVVATKNYSCPCPLTRYCLLPSIEKTMQAISTTFDKVLTDVIQARASINA